MFLSSRGLILIKIRVMGLVRICSEHHMCKKVIIHAIYRINKTLLMISWGHK